MVFLYMYFPGTVNPGLLNHQFIDRGLAILRVIYSITILGATQLSQLIVEGYYVRDWYIPIYLSGELKFWIWMACVAHVLLQGLEKNLRQFINRYWSEEADVEQREVYPGNDDRKLDTSTTGQAVLDTALQRVRHCRSIEPSPALLWVKGMAETWGSHWPSKRSNLSNPSVPKTIETYETIQFLGFLCVFLSFIIIWVNYNELTASSLEIIVSQGNHPKMALIKISELL